ncbi:MAG: YdcH family protein [Methyloligellaceae bacterium]
MGLAQHLAELSDKHQALDTKIEEEMARPLTDTLRISELKRRKLQIKDEIARLKMHSEQHSG